MSFERDVLGKGFSWRQVGLVVGIVALVVGLGRFLAATGNGRWYVARNDFDVGLSFLQAEEEDARIYRAYADGLADTFPASARVFEEMAEEEDEHRRRLIDLHVRRFGDKIPLLRREHVRGYYDRRPDWLVRPLGIEKTRDMAEAMENQAARFYESALERATDAGM